MALTNTATHTDDRRSIRSQSLDLLRFPLAVIVVSVHVLATTTFMMDGKKMSVFEFDGMDVLESFFAAFLRGQSVPIYFFIAGYVFFLGIKFTLNTYEHKLKNRTKSLLIPYISWNIVAILVAFYSYWKSHNHQLILPVDIRLDLSVQSFLECFWDSAKGVFRTGGESDNPFATTFPQDYPLWFVRDLMIIAVTTPLIYLCLQRTRWYIVAATGAAWFILKPFQLGHFSQLLEGYFYFSWGAYMSYHGKDMIAEFNKYFKTCTAIYLIVGFVLFLVPDIPSPFKQYLKAVNILVGMVMAYGIASRLIKSRRVKVSKFLAAASFFVYAGHGVFVGAINVRLFNVIQPTNFGQVTLIYFINIVLTVGILLLIFRLIGKYMPWLQKLLAGRTYK